MEDCVTSFCQPLLSLSKPARIDATPVFHTLLNGELIGGGDVLYDEIEDTE